MVRQQDRDTGGAPAWRPGVRAVIGSSLSFVVMVVAAVVIAPVALLLRPFSYSVRFAFVSLWARVNLLALRWFCGLRYQVEGRERIPVDKGVVFCKHQSTWETLALQEVLDDQAWVLKRELLRVPFFGWGLRALEPIAIDRQAGRKAVDQVVQEGKDRLAKGRWVIVFPEGTRLPVGQRKKFGVGGAILAKKAGAEILPIAHNAGSFWPRHGFIKKPGTIRMVIGSPIATRGKGLKQINDEAQSWIDAQTERLEQLARNGE